VVCHHFAGWLLKLGKLYRVVAWSDLVTSVPCLNNVAAHGGQSGVATHLHLRTKASLQQLLHRLPKAETALEDASAGLLNHCGLEILLAHDANEANEQLAGTPHCDQLQLPGNLLCPLSDQAGEPF
jgi:hypothetical protein